jgi:ABC transport system ATP-binding/permease protein
MLRAADLSLAFGVRTLFDRLELVIEEGERVGLIGVNGSGKSTLMKILAGAAKADSGELQLRRGATVTYLTQEPEFEPGASVASELTIAHKPLRAAIEAHHELVTRLGDFKGTEEEHDKLLRQMGTLAEKVDSLGGWDTEHQAKILLDKLGVKEWDEPVASLSGGQRKRVAVARALLSHADLLLLDEPTNHLDADTVDWLEEELDGLPGAFLLVTHDRYFLDDLVDRIVEIQPGGGLISYPGNYEAYLLQKATAEEEGAVQQHKRSRWIAQEVAWLRRGVEARRTKSKARIDRARKLMAEKGLVAPKAAALQIASAPRLSQTVLECEDVSKSYGGKQVLDKVSLILQRGERLGIVGKNGAGKTTLVRTLLGELAPDSGKVIVGKATKVAYYDQQRALLDPEQTVFESASGEDYVDIGGRRVALRDYLDDLLFPVPMQRMKVAALSGGERNRLLLAKLFLQGANLLVLDEPTNDLDLVTLNVLERLLLEFTGSVLLVTHDRYFLDKVATSILALEGDGRAIRYPGNYETYRTLKGQSQRAAAAEAKAASKATVLGQTTKATSAALGQTTKEAEAKAPETRSQEPKARRVAKLSFKDQRELDGMEKALEVAESRKSAAEAALADPASYTGANAAKMPALQAELDEATREVERLYARWQQLQDLAAGKS